MSSCRSIGLDNSARSKEGGQSSVSPLPDVTCIPEMLSMPWSVGLVSRLLIRVSCSSKCSRPLKTIRSCYRRDPRPESATRGPRLDGSFETCFFRQSSPMHGCKPQRHRLGGSTGPWAEQDNKHRRALGVVELGVLGNEMGRGESDGSRRWTSWKRREVPIYRQGSAKKQHGVSCSLNSRRLRLLCHSHTVTAGPKREGL